MQASYYYFFNTFIGSVFMLLAIYFFVRPNGDYRLSNFM